MNRTLKIIKPARWLSATLFIAIAGQAAADGIVKVPGETKGYLYDSASNPTSAEQEISLAVSKEGHFKEYRIESDPPGLICDEACPGTAQRLPVGSVTLRIIGKKPVSVVNIPLTGMWSEPCERTDTELDHCVFNLHALNARVSVEVSPDVKPGMTLPLPEGGEAMIVNIDARDGYVLVANHLKLDSNRIWLPFSRNWTSRLHVNSPTDGRINTNKLLELTANRTTAAFYCSNMDGDWYLPAEKELALLTTDALKKIPSLDTDSYLWSSTEDNLVKGTTRRTNKPYLELRVKALRNSNARIYNQSAYSYDQESDGSWTEDKPYTHKYQVLCFRRLPI